MLIKTKLILIIISNVLIFLNELNKVTRLLNLRLKCRMLYNLSLVKLNHLFKCNINKITVLDNIIENHIGSYFKNFFFTKPNSNSFINIISINI